MITLSNMTDHQCHILDCIWDCDSQAELEEYISTLDSAEQKEARSLVRLIITESIDMEQMRTRSNKQARDVLVGIMSK